MNFKIKRIVKPFFLFAFLCLLIACVDKNNKVVEVDLLKDVAKRNLGKKLYLPNDLKVYRPFKNYVADSTEMQYADYRIYSYINTSCGTCIDDIKLWDSLAPEFIKIKTAIFLIFGSDDQFELIQHICESGKLKKFSYPFFLDVQNKYIDNNIFMNESKHFETVLTNRENEILLMGNPIHSQAIKDLYNKEIKKMIELSENKTQTLEGVEVIPVK